MLGLVSHYFPPPDNFPEILSNIATLASERYQGLAHGFCKFERVALRMPQNSSNCSEMPFNPDNPYPLNYKGVWVVTPLIEGADCPKPLVLHCF